MKSNNDILAEYVREKYPEILRTIDFALYSFKEHIKNMSVAFKEMVTGTKAEEDKENVCNTKHQDR